MTTGMPDGRGDLFVAEFYPNLGEYLAEGHATGYDAAAGRTRFLLWLARHVARDAADENAADADGAHLIAAGNQGLARAAEKYDPGPAGPGTRRTERSMFEMFTDRARLVVVQAQEEARAHHHDSIGTGHVLLGLIHGEGVGPKALDSLGISLGTVRQEVEEIIGQRQEALRDAGEAIAAARQGQQAKIPFQPEARKVLELSLEESRALGHHYIGTEHILLGLIREGDGVAAQVLAQLGADSARAREQVVQLLSEYRARKERDQ